MNHFYHYKYKHGLQFVSTAPIDMIRVWFKEDYKKHNLHITEEDYPISIGVWRFKKLITKNK